MSRLIILSGRVGATLVAVGLALTLVSFIPPARMGAEYNATLFVEGESFSLLASTWVLNPQQILKVRASANTTVTFYLLDKKATEVYEWISQKAQSSDADHYYIDKSLAMNASLFDDFLSAHPSSILMEKELNMQTETLEYSPTKVINATLFVVNRTSNPATIEVNVEISTVIGPSRAMLPAQILLPSGVLLALPWLFSSWKEKISTKRRGRNLPH